MTNEEQIDWLCRLKADLNNGVIFTPWNKEFTEALNGVLDQGSIEDCRNCKKWDECPCGKEGHTNGTSIGYSIGECKEYEPSEVYISREDAINALRKALYDYEDKTEKRFKESKELNLEDWFQHRIFVQNMNDIDIQTILELPPVKPQTGHWEDYSNGWMCSNCGRDVSYESDFCPHCGANMRGEEEDVKNEEQNSLLTADERALFLNKLTHWLNDNFNDIVIGGWQDTDGEIFDLFFIKRERKTVKED